MFQLSSGHIIGILLALTMVTAVGLYAGKKVKNAADFTVGGKKAGPLVVAGSIIGTLVGGSSTVGTAQLAYLYGFSGWWFTLGAGIGCLLLGVFLAKPVYYSDKETVSQILAGEYGRRAGAVGSVCATMGIFINIIAQILASVALLTTFFPISPLFASLLTVLLMTCYVVFGGFWGAGMVGVLKLILLYVAVMGGGILAFLLGGGWQAFYGGLPHAQFFNLFARGFNVDFSAGFSLLVGVLSTQTYIQAILSAKSLKAARGGAYLSAFLIPPIGLAGIFIGLYMRLHYPAIKAAAAFPLFIMQWIDPLPAGIVMATLMLAAVGTGAGLSLGISTIITRDIYKVYINPQAKDNQLLLLSRVVILGVLLLAMAFSTGNIGSLILQWSFMSMGLRGAALFIPFCGALFLKGRVDSFWVVAAIVAGPVVMLAGKLFLPPAADPLLLAVFASGFFVLLGYVKHKIKKQPQCDMQANK